MKKVIVGLLTRNTHQLRRSSVLWSTSHISQDTVHVAMMGRSPRLLIVPSDTIHAHVMPRVVLLRRLLSLFVAFQITVNHVSMWSKIKIVWSINRFMSKHSLSKHANFFKWDKAFVKMHSELLCKKILILNVVNKH